jgi:hypothetical protein
VELRRVMDAASQGGLREEYGVCASGRESSRKRAMLFWSFLRPVVQWQDTGPWSLEWRFESSGQPAPTAERLSPR